MKEKAQRVLDQGNRKTMSTITPQRPNVSASTATRHYLGKLLDSACLSTDELQINHNSQVFLFFDFIAWWLAIYYINGSRSIDKHPSYVLGWASSVKNSDTDSTCHITSTRNTCNWVRLWRNSNIRYRYLRLSAQGMRY